MGRPSAVLCAYCVGFVLLWLAVAMSGIPMTLALPVPAAVWAIARAVSLRGANALRDDVPMQWEQVRRKRAELAFLVAIPVMLFAAHTAPRRHTEKILISLSVIYVVTHVPQAVTAATRGSLQPAFLRFGALLALAGCLSWWDVDISVWTSAALAPHDSACARGEHPLHPRIAAAAAALDELAPRMRQVISPVVVELGRLGEVPFTYTALLLMHAFGELATLSPRARRYLQVPLAAVVYGGVLSATLKIFVHRERPMVSGDPFVFSGPAVTWRATKGFSKTDLSFPSGHAVVTVGVAHSLIQLWMRDFRPSDASRVSHLLHGLPLYLVSAVVAASRFSFCLHWPSDCAAGAAIGVLVADVLVMGPLAVNYLPPPEPSAPLLPAMPAARRRQHVVSAA